MSDRTYGFTDLKHDFPHLSEPTLKRGLARAQIRKPQGVRRHSWDQKTYNFIKSQFICRLNYYHPERQDAGSGTFVERMQVSGISSQPKKRQTLVKTSRAFYAELRNLLSVNPRQNMGE